MQTSNNFYIARLNKELMAQVEVDHGDDVKKESELATKPSNGDVALQYSFPVPDIRDCESLAETRKAIDQLQLVIRDFTERYSALGEGVESAAQTAHSLKKTQDKLFGTLLAFEEVELTQLASSLDEVEKPQDGDFFQFQITQVQTTCEHLAGLKDDLVCILTSPPPLPIPTIGPSVDSGASPDPSQSEHQQHQKELCDRADMLLLQCQGLLDEYTQLRQSLQDQLQSKKDKSFSDLEDLESWLREVYTLLCLEPSKLWTSASALSPWHQPRHESTDAPQGGSLYEPPSALSQPSDDSLFEDTDMSPAVGAVLDRSVNPSLDDSQYMMEVDHMVISSPSDDGDGEEERASNVDDRSTVCGSEGQVVPPLSLADEFRDVGLELSPPPHSEEGGGFDASPIDLVELSPDVRVESHDVEGMSQEESPDLKDLSQGTSSDLTGLSQGTSPDLMGGSLKASPDSASYGASPDLKSAPGVKRELGRASPEQPFYLALQVGDSRTSHDPPNMSCDTPLIITSHEDGVNETLAHTVSAKNLTFVRLKHSIDCEVEKFGNGGDSGQMSHDLEAVLNKLKEAFEELGEKSNRSKATIANVFHHMSRALKDEKERTQLRKRLESLTEALDPLRERVAHRIAQLKFEKIQKAILDELVEAERDLDSQPTTNQACEVIQQNLSDLKEFFTTPEHFRAQVEEQLKEMEALVGQLLSYDREDASLLDHTLQQLKNTCHVICSRAGEQMVFLELCTAQWAKFHQCYGCLGDWLAQAKEKVGRETYGSTLEEVDSFGDVLEGLATELPSIKASKVVPLQVCGDQLLKTMDPSGPTRIQVQDTLGALLDCWHQLCDDLQTVQGGVISVLIGWKGYKDIKEGLTGFVERMVKSIGTDPTTASEGDLSQLATYKDHAQRVQAMEEQFDSLRDLCHELASNSRISGAAVLIPREVEDLEEKWSHMRGTIMERLEGLKTGQEKWVKGKMDAMKELAGEEDRMLSRVTAFIEGFPLDALLEADLTDLLSEVEELMKYEEKLLQLDNDFMSVEDEMQNVPAEDLSEGTGEEISELQVYHHDIQQLLQTSGGVVNTFQVYLDLARKIQEASAMVNDAAQCFGSSHELESKRVALQLKLSDDLFSTLEQEVVDLDSITERYGSLLGDSSLPCGVPPVEGLTATNFAFSSAVKEMSSKAGQALERICRLIGHWAQYKEGKEQVMPWVEGVELRMKQVAARSEGDLAPHMSPHDLLTEAKGLLAELSGNDKTTGAYYDSAQAILVEITSSAASEGFRTELSATRARLEGLGTSLERLRDRCEQKVYNYDTFLTSLGELNVKLCAQEAMLNDELCEAFSGRVSSDVLCASRARWKGLMEGVEKLKDTYAAMCLEGDRWSGHLVHSDFLLNFAPDDLSDQGSKAPTVESRVTLVKEKWNQVQSLLAKRRDQLEMVTGDTASFQETLEGLLSWLGESLRSDEVMTTPTSSDQLRRFIDVIQALSSDMDGRRSEEKESLHQRYGDLKPRLSEANAHKVEQAMLELQVRWSELCRVIARRTSELCPLRDKVEHFWSVLGEVKGCLVEMERRYDQCGPIGAHLERLLEQGPILQALDEDFLTHKEDPDRVYAEAAEIGVVWGGGKEELTTKADQLRKQFVDFSERLVEQRERCEEAVAAMQQLQKEYDTFGQSLCEASNKHKLWTERRAPIGVIGSELEEYYDFMRETEGLTKQYSSLHCHSQQLSSKYKPSDHLEGIMVSMNTRWAELVAMLEQHCGEKLGLKGRWEEYAGEVKGLLGWMTQEANRFSREVTEIGEKGIEDHVESCQVFTDTLGAKVGCRERVLTLGEELLPHDAEKKNGTSDVASRIHDVQVHWESVCKLLEETILRLEATKSQLGYILQVTGEEFDWLERMEERSRDQKASHGRIEVIEEEINLHETMYQEVESHAHFKTFICEETLKFTLEHLRGKDRGPAAMRAKDFASRYESLSRKLGAYVDNLRESIPLWAQFTGLQGTLVQELGDARGMLGSVNPKTFMTTQKSLEVVKLLSEGLGTMQDRKSTLVHVCGDLRPLCVQEDQNYIQQLVGEVSDDLGDLTSHVEESVESLEQRMKSWEVLPVEDVMAVQEFLEQAQNMMMSSEGEETSEDLEEKVKRLESMLQSQDTNAQKVDYIDQSSKSEAVKKSLEKNPDISQEKDRLLNDWSSVSAALKRKFEETRKCASVTKEMESLLARCQKAMEEYQTFLSQPLPPSPQLKLAEETMSLDQSSLHSSCEEAVSMVTSTLKRSLAEGIAVPPHLQGKAEAVVDHFDGLTSQANRRARGISQTLARWQNFTVIMEKCRSQLPDFQSELSGLAQVEEFLMELSSLESRLSILEEKVQADVEELEETKRDLPSHLFGDDLQVTAKMADFSHLLQQWTELKDSVERLKANLIPWKKLVDVQEELQNRFDQLRATVEEQLEHARRSGEEQEDITEYLGAIKDCLLKLEGSTPELEDFHQSYVPRLGAKVCSRHPPAQQFSDVCVRLEDDWRNLLQRLRGSVEEMAVKAQTWRREAAQCMRQYRSTKALLDTATSKMADHEEVIRSLTQRLEQGASAPSLHLSARTLLLLLAAVIIVATVLYLGTAKSPPALRPL